jgi:DNA-binding protein Fis
LVSSNIQEQAVKIVEDFFLNRTDKDVYTFIQEVLGRPLAEKVMEKNKDNQLETARILGLLYYKV